MEIQYGPGEAYRSPEETGEWRGTVRKALFAETETRPQGQEEPEFRFYALYDRNLWKDALAEAWRRCEPTGEHRSGWSELTQ